MILKMKKNKCFFVVIVMSLILFNSCISYKKVDCEGLMSTYTSSANSARMDKYFISLPVSIYLGEGYTMSDATEESSRGFVVCKTEILYNLIYKDKYSEENYANFLLASLMRKKTLVLTEEEYEKIKSYTISKEDAYSFLKINFKRLVRENTKGQFLPNINSLADLNYNERCIIHSFFYHVIPC